MSSTAVGRLTPAKISSADFLSGSKAGDRWCFRPNRFLSPSLLVAPRMFLTASAASSSLLISLIEDPICKEKLFRIHKSFSLINIDFQSIKFIYFLEPTCKVSWPSSARIQTCPAPCFDFEPFRKCGFMLRLCRTLFFHRSSSALKYG